MHAKFQSKFSTWIFYILCTSNTKKKRRKYVEMGYRIKGQNVIKRTLK